MLTNNKEEVELFYFDAYETQPKEINYLSSVPTENRSTLDHVINEVLQYEVLKLKHEEKKSKYRKPSMQDIRRGVKRREVHQQAVPILFMKLKTSRGKEQSFSTDQKDPIHQYNTRRSTKKKARNIKKKPSSKMLRVLLDSGASSTIITRDHVKHLRCKRRLTSTRWKTAGGDIETSTTTEIEFSLPEFSTTRKFTCKNVHVTEKPISQYDVIIGRDLLADLGAILNFDTGFIHIRDEDVAVPMKTADATVETALFIKEDDAIEKATERLSTIKDADYQKADFKKIVNSLKHLVKDGRKKVFHLLKRFEPMFDGKLGKWNDKPYKIELKKDAKPFHAKAYPVAFKHEEMLRKEVERLCRIGVLRKVNRSEWAAPSFPIAKKNGTVRFISDFRELNKMIVRKPFPIPKIQDMLLKLQGFTYATSLDLNMGYYHITLDPASQRLCTIIMPWGKYEYQALPMGLCNSPDIFQERMSELFMGFEYVRTYLDDLLIITKGTLDDHLSKVTTVIKKLQEKGLKINAEKSKFCAKELEYLGYMVTRDGINPTHDKVQALLNIKAPTTRRQLRGFIGMVNFYRDLWIRRSDVSAPLTALCSEKVPFKWLPIHDQAFKTLKRIIAHHTTLTYPDFTKSFDIHTDSSDTQMGAVISQDGKPIAFYSKKLNPSQRNYTTTEKELLAIVETLKEYRTILFGHLITVYTDHKNLTYKVFNTQRVIRWRLICEEYGPVFEIHQRARKYRGRCAFSFGVSTFSEKRI